MALTLIMKRPPTSKDISNIDAALGGLTHIATHGITLKQGKPKFLGGSGTDTWSADISVGGETGTITITGPTLLIPANIAKTLTETEKTALLTQMTTYGLINSGKTWLGGYRHKRSGRRSSRGRKSKRRSSKKRSSRKSRN